MCRSAPNKTVKRILNARKELPRGLHAHSLRHSFISLLIANSANKISIIEIARIAGDTPEIITKVYAHSFNELHAQAMSIIGVSFSQLTLPS